jgi:hypothetical protein
VDAADDHVKTCNTLSLAPSATGSRAECVSAWGTFDMVGNEDEWTADWTQLPASSPGWGSFSDDIMSLAGASTMSSGPGVLFRGGGYGLGAAAGPFALQGLIGPQGKTGFRCVR